MSNAETWTWLLVAVGVIFRLLEYADNRPLYMDEGLLLQNLVELPVFDFSTTLTKDQLAAPGFLVVERMMVRLPLSTVWAARLIPFLCGIASMFLMRSVARRYLSPAPSRSRWGFSPSMIGCSITRPRSNSIPATRH